MIASLRGVLLQKIPPRLVVEVGGVGYELLAPLSTFPLLPEVGSEVRLWTVFRLQNDGAQLFGFASEEERSVFQELLRISGVGPRTALAILSGISPGELAEIVSRGDEERLQKLPGIGKKTASRLLFELRERLETGAEPGGVRREAEEALRALGFQPREIERLLDGTAGETLEELLRKALKRASLR